LMIVRPAMLIDCACGIYCTLLPDLYSVADGLPDSSGRPNEVRTTANGRNYC
jgi:hypothetical protein